MIHKCTFTKSLFSLHKNNIVFRIFRFQSCGIVTEQAKYNNVLFIVEECRLKFPSKNSIELFHFNDHEKKFLFAIKV